LAPLDKKTCFACGSAEHKIKMCKGRILRYSHSRHSISNTRQAMPNNRIATPGRSYAAAVKSTPSDLGSSQPPKQSSPPSSDLQKLKSMLTNISTDLELIKCDFKVLRDSVYVLENQQREFSQVQELVNHFHTVVAANNTSASDLCIRENFPILLKDFEILQKELYRISADMTILKASVSLADSDDEDYEDEGDDRLSS